MRPGFAESSSKEYFLFFASARPLGALPGSNHCKLNSWFVEFWDNAGGVNSTLLVTNLGKG